MNKRKVGGYYEEQAALFLEKQGLVIQERNFRCKMGEVDLIAKDGAAVVFVEVKYRFSEKAGTPLEAVDKKKQKIISRAALWYLTVHFHRVDLPCRFDVVGFVKEKPVGIKNAFDFCG